MTEETTHQPSRVIVGHCPDCAEILVVFNNYETWPLVRCNCGWVGDTLAVENRVRMDRGGEVHP